MDKYAKTKEGYRRCLKELHLGTDKLSNKQSFLIGRAVEYAAKSQCHQKHGAIVVKSGRIIATSCNKANNNPAHFCEDLFNEYRGYISTHAEVAALKMVSPQQARGATVYVARIMSDGSPGYSKPCPNCARLLDELGIKKVIYT